MQGEGGEIVVDIPHGRRGTFFVKPPLWIAVDVYIDNTDDITIGEGVSLSQGVMIYTHEHYHERGKKIMDLVQEKGVQSSPLVIEDDVYIGVRAIILEGCCHIGKGAVIGAGAIVTKDIPANQVWAGNPARFIKELYPF